MILYYHCSPTPGLTVLEPRQPKVFGKAPRVYMTTLLPMALMYGIRNFEYTYGYTKTGEIYLEEYFPNALDLYRGKRASLYICAPTKVEGTAIPNEAVSEVSVPVMKEILIPDVYEALLEQQRQGKLTIRRYEELSEATRSWIIKANTQVIQQRKLQDNPGPMADYYRVNYPACWEAARE